MTGDRPGNRPYGIHSFNSLYLSESFLFPYPTLLNLNDNFITLPLLNATYTGIV